VKPGDIVLGQPVLSRDGHSLGTVDRFVLNDATHQIEQIVVHKLLHHGDKLIDVAVIDRSDADGVVLSIDASEVAALPNFVRETYVDLSQSAALDDTYMSMATTAGAGSFLVEAPVAGRRTLGAETSDFFDAAIPQGATVEDVSNLASGDDVMSAGTDVIASDGRRVGKVHEVTYGADGGVTGFVVKEGVLFKHDVRIPIERVATMGAKHVHLNVTAEEAEASGR
jgi:uncharacterized protein YrrD